MCTGICVLVSLVVIPAVQGVTITLWTNNIVIPQGRTFQMPITASDPDGQPLHFGFSVSQPKVLTGQFAPASNRSLVLNVSGVDSNNDPFTGDMVLQLFEDLTPLSTAHIIDSVTTNFYDGKIFGRVIQDFVVQEGTTTSGGLPTSFDDEFVTNLTYTGFGQLGLANSGHDANNSQFFITDADLSVANPDKPAPEHIDFQNPIFGQMTAGFDVLAKLISTPVSGSAPLTSNVINSATIITNSQDGVLRLTASPKALERVTVTVSATNAANQFTSQTFTVTTMPETNNAGAFIGPLPASITVTQNTAASFKLTAFDLEGDSVSFLDGYNGSGQPFTNMFNTFNPLTDQFWISPDLNLTGSVDVIIGGRDNQHPYDTQVFTLDFVPRSATPTMVITSIKGSILNAGTPLFNLIKLIGTFAFTNQSDGTFGSNDVIDVKVGNPTKPLHFVMVPTNRGYSFSKGVLKTKGFAATGSNPQIFTLCQFDGVKKTFKVEAVNFQLPPGGEITNGQIVVDFNVGNDYTGTNVYQWIPKRGNLVISPKP